MEAKTPRRWVSAVSVSVAAFVLVVLINVAGLDKPLSESWTFQHSFRL